MVVDQRERADGLDPAANLRLGDGGARQIAKRFGASTAARFDQLVELLEQRALHGYAEADESIGHAWNLAVERPSRPATTIEKAPVADKKASKHDGGHAQPRPISRDRTDRIE